MKTRFFTLLFVLLCRVNVFALTEFTNLSFTLYTNHTAEVVRPKSTGNYVFSTPTKVIIPSTITYNDEIYTVTRIGENAFLYQSNLYEVEIPESVTYIGKSAFYASGLTSLVIPNSVTNIESYAFEYCDSIKSITIGTNLGNIGIWAFEGCENIMTVTWNAINCSSWNFGNQVTSFTFGEEVQKIPSSTCEGMTLLTSITIPNSVTSIGSSAFSGCIGLTSITIPNSVTSIGSSAFSDCSDLSGELIIPNSVTSIGSNAFANCIGLTSIVIEGRPRLSANSFNGCTNLQGIYCLSDTPPIANAEPSCLSNTNDCPIYYPCGMYENYKYVFTMYLDRLYQNPDCAQTFTVTFQDWNGQVLKIEQVEEGHSATAPANPTREGYTFTGWDKDFSNVQSDLTITAQYTQNTPSATYYTITFKDWDGTILKSEQVEKGHSATAPANPTREGYTFTGWDKDFSNVQSNLTVTAQYKKNETPVTNAITVRLKASSATGWSKVNLYYWADGISSPAWPGITIAKDANGWYSHTFDATVKSVSIIWNDGNNQTTDIENITESTCYSLKSTSGKSIGVNVVECEAETPVSVTGVSLNKKTLQMVVGNTATLTASILPTNASNKSVTWTSSNTATATVSSTGTISAKAEGVTTITCKTVDGNFTAECYVVVSAVNSEYNFSYEPKNAKVINFTASNLYYDEIPEENCVFVILEDNNHTLNLMYIGSLVNGTIPKGNYKVTSTFDNGTFFYSVGGDDQYDYGSYLATDFNSEGQYSSAYYVIAGDIIIGSKNSYDVKVISANGTEINVTYNLTQDIEDIQSIQNASKIFHNGQIYILRGNKIYSVTGQEVK